MTTVFDRNPTNPNFLHPNKFQLNFARVPNIQYFCQSVSVPGLNMSEVPQNNPFIDLYSPGEKMIYDLLNITFLVDEDMKCWKEIHDWIRAMTFPKEYKEYKELATLNKLYVPSNKQRPQYSDGTITLLSSANNPIMRFRFFDLFPISLSSFIMSSSDSPENIITADVSFRFSYFDIIEV